MTSRYALYDIAKLSKHFHLAEGLPKGIRPHYNYSPTMDAPVILNEDGARIIKRMKWGLVAKGSKDFSSVFRYKTYNVPSDKIFSKHSWRQSVLTNRCLIPANGFYDLQGSSKALTYFVEPEDKALLAFAGVHSSWEDPEGVVHGTFSIITTDANHDMPSSSSRMPIIISREDEARWLDPAVSSISPLYDMLRQYPNGLLSAREVSSAVRSIKANQPSLIEPIA